MPQPNPESCKEALNDAIIAAMAQFEADYAACIGSPECQQAAYARMRDAIAKAVQAFFECLASTYGIPQNP